LQIGFDDIVKPTTLESNKCPRSSRQLKNTLEFIDLGLKGMTAELNAVMEQRVQQPLDLLSTLERLADIELKPHFQNAIALGPDISF
jgi:hypothetical protein